ncbi:MAG: uncharacterized protein JWM90_699 [Thermoleophilia bacterium]|nr:uncharacterized protein [Thermoleophilia bacterium]
MTRYLALLRGINLGANRRVAMARLRELLGEVGYVDVATHLQSGNVLLGSTRSASAVAKDLAQRIEAEWGFAVPVIVRTEAQLAAVVAADPLGDVATDPARYLVTFFEHAPKRDALDALDADELLPERFALLGSEVYTWMPDGVQNSPVQRALAKLDGQAPGTARNWRTVTKLLELLQAP